MATKTNETIHAETAAEISRQIKIHNDRRTEIVNERARLYGSLVGGGAAPVVDADTRAIREHARHLLNGYAPESLSLPPEISRDRELSREQAAIDLVIKILGSKEVAARAAAAVVWGETNRAAWQELCRQIILTAIQLDALERRAGQLLEQCPDVSAVRMPLINAIGSRAICETPLGDLVERALAENVVSGRDVEKARSSNG